MKKETDEQLIQALAAGDIDSFDEIVSRYQELAWKTAHRFLGDSMEAEDVAQEAFLRVLESAPRYRPTAAFRTYFYRILTRLCIDRSRKRRTTLSEIPDMPDPSSSAPELLIENERKARIRAALETLPANQRAAIILRHYEGLSYAEIAQVLDLTTKAVERLLSRAVSSLQSRLTNI